MSRLPDANVTREELYNASDAGVYKEHVEGLIRGQEGVSATVRFNREFPEIAGNPELRKRASDMDRALVESGDDRPAWERMREIGETISEAMPRPVQTEPTRSEVIRAMGQARIIGRGSEETAEQANKRFLKGQRIEADRRARESVATVADPKRRK